MYWLTRGVLLDPENTKTKQATSPKTKLMSLQLRGNEIKFRLIPDFRDESYNGLHGLGVSLYQKLSGLVFVFVCDEYRAERR
jgi:hypothetical protein